MCFPEEEMVYDYRLDDAGASRKDDEEEEEDRKVSDAPGQIVSDQNPVVLVLMVGWCRSPHRCSGSAGWTLQRASSSPQRQTTLTSSSPPLTQSECPSSWINS